MNNILVIGAHYDDAELGVGGSMSRWVMENKKVFKITLTNNTTNFVRYNIIVDYENSKKESSKACKIIGCEEIVDFPVANCTDLVYNKKQMQLLESFIIDKKIDTIVIHNLFDIQQDHVHASTISYVAGRYCNNILMYQSNRYILPYDFYPRIFIDITKTIDIKKKALKCYNSVHDRNKMLFDSTIEQNKIWGYQSFMTKDVKYCEAFNIIKLMI